MKLVTKWVSQIDRVSSKKKPAGYLAFLSLFVAGAFLGVSCVLAADITPQKVIDLANADRKNKGISELVENEKLSRAAMDKAQDMIADNYFSHNAPDGTTPWHWFEKENYDYSYAGENLAMDFVSAEKMNEAWLASPTHRANILNEKYKDIGVAAEEGIVNGHSTIAVVQMFGSGDKNASQKESVVKLPAEEKSKKENNFPALPAGETKNKKIVLEKTFITWPRNGEVVSSSEMEIVGRSWPEKKVAVFDNEVAAGTAVSDREGWFRLKIKNIPEGSHKLAAKTEKLANGGNKSETPEAISFYVDRTKPELNYFLYANGRSGDYVIKLYSNKSNCSFELGGRKAANHPGQAAVFSVGANQSSVVASVSDRVGNKTKKQISLASYYAGSGEKNLVGSLVSSFLPQSAYAADSGRRALAHNLGIKTGGSR